LQHSINSNLTEAIRKLAQLLRKTKSDTGVSPVTEKKKAQKPMIPNPVEFRSEQ